MNIFTLIFLSLVTCSPAPAGTEAFDPEGCVSIVESAAQVAKMKSLMQHRLSTPPRGESHEQPD